VGKLSVLLPTFNEANTALDCLESVKWADEIVVVDSYSTDATLGIVSQYGAKVIQHEYMNSARQKNWAIPQCKHEWVLQVDADERLQKGAREEILERISKAGPEVHAFCLPRKNHVLGQWIKAGSLYPDYQTRVFRRDVGRFEDKELHAHLRVPGRVETLRHHILHNGMSSISQQLDNLDRYARYQADELNKRGKRPRWYHLVVRPFATFAYYYLWRRGFTAGYRGLIVCAINSTFDFWVHAKLWELQALGLQSSPK
jgi:glycosyltransferase involved in cell wall biosynthesis